MAETTAITSTRQAREALEASNRQRDALRAQYKDALAKDKKERQAEIAKERDKNKALLKQIKGPNVDQIGGDLGGMVVGEAAFRALQFGLTKLGATSPLWYTMIPGVLGSVCYALTYPRKDEGMIRAALRASAQYWSIIGLHDGVSVLMAGGQNRAAEAAAQAREIAALQQQLAAASARPPAK